MVAKPLDDPYLPGERKMLKVKHERTADCVCAGFRIHKDGKGVGSLLCGLYDDEGVLHHVGVASGMAAPVRKQLLAEVEPLRKDVLAEHPWREWAAASMEAAASGQRMPGGPSRWNADKDLSWEPVRIERVDPGRVRGAHERAVPAQRPVPALALPTRIRPSAPTPSSRRSPRPSCARCSAAPDANGRGVSLRTRPGATSATSTRSR